MKDWTPAKYSVVCCKHIHDCVLVTTHTRTNIECINKIVLKQGASPALFPPLPDYFSGAPRETRKAPAQLLAEIDARDDAVLNDFLMDNLLVIFLRFCLNYDRHVNASIDEG